MSFKAHWQEFQIVSLPGPSHYYGGLAAGNHASKAHRHLPSSPQKAAYEILHWIKLMHQREVPLLFLPPLMPSCDRLGLSSAYIWCANLGLFTPSCDSKSQKPHLTLANLYSGSHRVREAPLRKKQLQHLFKRAPLTIHAALPQAPYTYDEGAANHMRLCSASDYSKGLDLMIYGFSEKPSEEKRLIGFYRPRQSQTAQEKIVKMHQIPEDRVLFAKQNPEVIAKGVFHNDVISTSHNELLLYHEKAFKDPQAIDLVRSKYWQRCKEPLITAAIAEEELTVEEAVQSYLFNSQILTRKNQKGYLLITPEQCRKCKKASSVIERLLGDPAIPIEEWVSCHLSESMKGGGGPACLRLRALLNAEELSTFDPRFIVTEKMLETLQSVVERYWPETIDGAQVEDTAYQKMLYERAIEGIGALHDALDLGELLN